jgi:hypothetical protein
MQNILPVTPKPEQLSFDPKKAEQLNFEIGHIGINSDSMEQAQQLASTFCLLFNLPIRQVPGVSFFADPLFECMGKRGHGANGHICILTDSVPEAMDFLTARGTEFLPETAKYDENGKIVFIYLKGEAGGFAIHLKQR